jgi:nicotinate phosphoribosyltransferase
MIERAYGLTTDLYELTMAAAYFENGLHQPALFDLFIRRLPDHRSYLITAGLEQVLEYLSELRFTPDQIDYLRKHPVFKRVSDAFFDYLTSFRFTGDVWAMPEGTAAFAMEPLLRVKGPIIEAQIVETFLLSTLNFQTMIASKAARVVRAAQGRSVIEFGTRRAHGSEAGLFAARAAYIGGCIGTSNVEAGLLFGIPTFGTLAHSFVMSFENEDDAFRAFINIFPENATVLVDTYDTIAAVKRLARQYKDSAVPAVRLDSGDLCELSKEVRQILDDAGMTQTKIFASSDLNEFSIADLISRGAQIDSFGVGTELATSYDAPAISGVYKLSGIEENGQIKMRIKLSKDKATYPGAKQVWRLVDSTGKYIRDVISLADEAEPRSEPGGTAAPLLKPVMRHGQILQRPNAGVAGLNPLRDRALQELEHLPADLLLLKTEARYPVIFSNGLENERARIESHMGGLQ